MLLSFALPAVLGLQAVSVAPPQDTSFANLTPLRVRTVFIVAADDNGGHGHTRDYGRKGVDETPQFCADFVRQLNKNFACASIQFSFDAKTDYHVRHKTALNRSFYSELDGSGVKYPEEAMYDPTKRPTDIDSNFVREWVALEREFAGRVVILLRDDSQWVFDRDKKRWVAVTSSGGTFSYGIIQANGVNVPVITHELGHYFGLGHTFPNKTYTTPSEAILFLKGEVEKGKSLSEAINYFDGDGFSDTPPDPGRPFLENLGHKQFRPVAGYEIGVSPANQPFGTWEITPHVYNWMSYYRESRIAHPTTGMVEGRFSRQQCEQMYYYTKYRIGRKTRDQGIPGRVAGNNATVTVSHKSGQLPALNDGVIGISSEDTEIPRFSWWPHLGTAEWVQYEFAAPETFSRATAYWMDERYSRRPARVPQSWQLQSWDGKNWANVEAISDFGILPHQLNQVEFKSRTAKKWRLMVQLQKDFGAGLIEWQLLP